MPMVAIMAIAATYLSTPTLPSTLTHKVNERLNSNAGFHNGAICIAHNMVTKRKGADAGALQVIVIAVLSGQAADVFLPLSLAKRERARMKSSMRGAISLRKRDPLKTP